MTDYVIDYLKQNYETLGPTKCAEYLKLPIKHIKYIANKKLKLFVSQTVRDEYRRAHTQYPLKIDISDLLLNPDVCYILGYIYADGHIAPKSSNLITLTIAEEDMNIIKPSLSVLSDWTFYHTKPTKTHHKPMVKARMTNVDLMNFLRSHNYVNKSHVSPFDLFINIPDNLKHYFIRGFLDGDGSIYISPKKKVALAFYATIDNDWSIIQYVFDMLGIKGYIYKSKKIKGEYSHFRTSKKSDIIKLCEYIYQDFDIDKIGLMRKYNKFLEIMNSQK